MKRLCDFLMTASPDGASWLQVIILSILILVLIDYTLVKLWGRLKRLNNSCDKCIWYFPLKGNKVSGYCPKTHNFKDSNYSCNEFVKCPAPIKAQTITFETALDDRLKELN